MNGSNAGGPLVHHCLTGSAACSGLNPCARCFEHVRQRVVARMATRTGMNFAPQVQILLEAYGEGYTYMQLELGRTPGMVVSTVIQNEMPQASGAPVTLPLQQQPFLPQQPTPVYPGHSGQALPFQYQAPISPQVPPQAPQVPGYPPGYAQPVYAQPAIDPDLVTMLRAQQEEAAKKGQEKNNPAPVPAAIPLPPVTTINAAEPPQPLPTREGGVVPRLDEQRRVDNLATPMQAEEVEASVERGVQIGSVMAPGWKPATERSKPPAIDANGAALPDEKT